MTRNIQIMSSIILERSKLSIVLKEVLIGIISSTYNINILIAKICTWDCSECQTNFRNSRSSSRPDYLPLGLRGCRRTHTLLNINGFKSKMRIKYETEKYTLRTTISTILKKKMGFTLTT